jgi:hypothetical protein
VNQCEVNVLADRKATFRDQCRFQLPANFLNEEDSIVRNEQSVRPHAITDEERRTFLKLGLKITGLMAGGTMLSLVPLPEDEARAAFDFSGYENTKACTWYFHTR